MKKKKTITSHHRRRFCFPDFQFSPSIGFAVNFVAIFIGIGSRSEGMSADHFANPESGNKKKLKALLHKSDNRICADCSAPNPKWASSNIGVFICVKCSGVHRGLGSHISKVLSVTLDEWSDDEINSMIEVGGNSYANAIYEAFLPKKYHKPRENASTEERTAFIRSKYELQEFLTPSLRIISQNYSKSTSLDVGDFTEDVGAFNSETSNRTEGLVEFIGILHAKVVKGTRLAVRDMLTSDPYVVLISGQQRVQTTVAHSNLNPLWNEILKLSIPWNYGPLKVEVYDHDTLSADDIMGQAEIDLQPLINSASAFRNPELLGDMQIGKWHKSEDNALAEDSTVNIVKGKVKQVVRVKLQNVESGEIELELEWISLDQ